MRWGSGPFWVYVLENPSGKLYVGSTDDLTRRLTEHNDPQRSKSKFTAKHGPWALVWAESHCTRAAAVKRERQIKAMKSARWIRDNLLGR